MATGSDAAFMRSSSLLPCCRLDPSETHRHGQCVRELDAIFFRRAQVRKLWKEAEYRRVDAGNQSALDSGLVLHQNGDHAAPKLSASELPPGLREIALDVGTLADYVGKYRLAPDAIIEIALRGDHLETQLTGQPAFPIYASAKDKFVDAQLDFERDAGEKVVAVVLHQNGRAMRAPQVTTRR